MIVPPRDAPAATEPVLIVIPCLNEEGHIERVLTQLTGEADRLNLRIIVADGGSTDETRAIVSRMADSDNRILLRSIRSRGCVQSIPISASSRIMKASAIAS